MLEHADAGDFVESISAEAVSQIAVVEQQHFDTIAQPVCGDPLAREVILVLRQRDADGAHSVVASRVQNQPAPAAAHIEQPFARSASRNLRQM